MSPKEKNTDTEVGTKVTFIGCSILLIFIGGGAFALFILSRLGFISFISPIPSPTSNLTPETSTATNPSPTPNITTQSPTNSPIISTNPNVTTSTPAITTTSVEDDILKVTYNGASFSEINDIRVVSASINIENKSGKDLLLAAEYDKYRLISDSGQSATGCGFNGLKVVAYASDRIIDYQKIRPNEIIAISMNNCQGIDPSKTKTLSLNIPIFQLLEGNKIESNRPVPDTISFNNIPIKQ
jgi:hypothetical protein